MYAPVFTGRMSEDSLIRRTNLRNYCAAKKWGPAALGRAIRRSTQQCSDLLAGRASFGETIARHIENLLELPRNWLDFPHSREEIQSVVSSSKDGHHHTGEKTSRYGALDAEDAIVISDDVVAPVLPRGQGGTPLPSTVQIHSLPGKTEKRAPVVEWVRLGEVLHKSNAELQVDAYRGYTSVNAASEEVKCVQVQGDWLAPELRTGDWAFVDPTNLKPKSDRVALFRAIDGSLFFNRYRPLPGDEFECYDSAGRTLSSSRHRIEIVAALVTMQRDNV